MFLNLNIFSSITKSVLSNPLAKDIFARFKSKKSSGCTRNRGGRPRPKHRGPKVAGNALIKSAGKILFLQRKLRIHPGLNVGLGKNFTLYALEPGRVSVTYEKFDPNWDHSFVIQAYGHMQGQTIYKKYYNIIAEPQHNRFNLIHLK